MAHDLRTPLKSVRRLGSARHGTGHFVRQRLTAIANLVLIPLAMAIVISLVGADHASARRLLGQPAVAVLLALVVVSGLVHMRLGMQTIIEDYVHGEGAKIVLLMLNTFFAILVGAACVYAVLKLGFGG